ncbi:MAG TPA: preprotein translocase subunit YajC [Streptosporangiaceae bacterium]|nr:preprotein translocase subunit YajC [Streptosporangiaceae bacterium]
MGTMTIAAGMLLAKTSSTPAKGGSSVFTFVILAVLIALFYFLIMRPQRNRQRKMMQTQNQVLPGQRVRTTAGMYGTVVSGDDRDVIIEIAPGVNVTMLRRAVMDVISDDQPMPETIDDSEHADGATANDWDFNDGSSASQDVDAKDRNG